MKLSYSNYWMKISQPRVHYSAKLSFTFEEGIKEFSDKELVIFAIIKLTLKITGRLLMTNRKIPKFHKQANSRTALHINYPLILMDLNLLL